MKKIEFLQWVLEIDSDKTKEFYKKEQDVCTCLDCENLRASCTFWDSSVMELFLMLGIDPAKPSHLSEFGEVDDGKRLYIGNFHVIGIIVEGRVCTSSIWNKDNTLTIGDITIAIEEDLTGVPDGFPSPVLQIGFEMRLPWVLEEASD